MWVKYLLIFVLFYILTVLEKSFLAHFNFWQWSLDLVFIFFILLLFFNPGKKNIINENIFWATTAGFFLSIYSDLFFGAEIIILCVIALATNKIKKSLIEQKDKYPISYFALVFTVSFILYKVFLWGLHFWQGSYFYLGFGLPFLYDIIYNLLMALIFFYVFKKIQGKK